MLPLCDLVSTPYIFFRSAGMCSLSMADTPAKAKVPAAKAAEVPAAKAAAAPAAKAAAPAPKKAADPAQPAPKKAAAPAAKEGAAASPAKAAAKKPAAKEEVWMPDDPNRKGRFPDVSPNVQLSFWHSLSTFCFACVLQQRGLQCLRPQNDINPDDTCRFPSSSVLES